MSGTIKNKQIALKYYSNQQKRHKNINFDIIKTNIKFLNHENF